jgi:hypothetical protein
MYRSNDGISFTAMLHCAPISRISPAEGKKKCFVSITYSNNEEEEQIQSYLELTT